MINVVSQQIIISLGFKYEIDFEPNKLGAKFHLNRFMRLVKTIQRFHKHTYAHVLFTPGVIRFCLRLSNNTISLTLIQLQNH